MKQLFERIVNEAISINATDIHFFQKEECQIRIRVFDELKTIKILPLTTSEKLLNYIRYISNIDLNYKFKPQTGQYRFILRNIEYALRISSFPTSKCDSIVIRILNQEKTLSIDECFPLKQVSEKIKNIVKRQYGLFLISGPTGSGKSTTLYALLDHLYMQSMQNIITLEDPIEVSKDYALQIQINEELDITYEKCLHQILRHDPNIIVIGEIRDEEVAKMAITCALTGHLVIATIHAGGAILTILRMIQLGCLHLDLQEVLIGIISQRMIFENKKRFVITEIMDKLALKEYFLGDQKIDYDFHDCLEQLVKNEKISNQFKEQYCQEKL